VITFCILYVSKFANTSEMHFRKPNYHKMLSRGLKKTMLKNLPATIPLIDKVRFHLNVQTNSITWSINTFFSLKKSNKILIRKDA